MHGLSGDHSSIVQSVCCSVHNLWLLGVSSGLIGNEEAVSLCGVDLQRCIITTEGNGIGSKMLVWLANYNTPNLK